MELTKKEVLVLLMLLEREEHSQGLFPTEEELVRKLQAKYRELGGFIKD
jgi:hypothetical protein